MEKRRLKIAVTGPESTGKTTLAEMLAKEFGASLVPEYAREFLKGRKPPYTLSDLEQIAQGQKEREQKELAESKGLLISDSEMTVLKIWSEHAFGYCLPIIERFWMEQEYDLYLLMNTDIPWEPDPLREHPHLREHLFTTFKKYLDEMHIHYIIISGEGNQRTEQARNAILNLINLA
jgi:NadR type nicotinamide-nucleotide adenylyltransferase